MKKMLLVMAAGALFAAGTATADTVTSVNVVGYHSITIPENGIALVTPVLESFGAGTLEDLVGDQLPAGSFAWIWDRAQNTYISGSRSGFGGWGLTNVILRGDAVWLKPKTGTGAHTITFMGEVPAEYNLAGTTTVHNIAGIDAVGYSYPVDIVWTNTTLAAAAPSGAFLYVWNIESQGYATYSKSGFGGWNTPAGYTIKSGQAFWIKAEGPIDWVEEAPYDL